TTVAGNGLAEPLGDDGPATQAGLSGPTDVALAADGSMFIADSNHNRVRRVLPDATIVTVAGDGLAGPGPLGGAAERGRVPAPRSVAVRADGTIYIAAAFDVREVAASWPGLAEGDLLIPSQGGGEAYQFDSQGRHLRTVDTTTGAVAYTFGYDSTG